jgi:hypothetical protein
LIGVAGDARQETNSALSLVLNSKQAQLDTPERA